MLPRACCTCTPRSPQSSTATCRAATCWWTAPGGSRWANGTLAGALRGCRVCTCLCWPQQFALLLHGHHQALQPNALQVSDFNLSKVLDDSMRNSSLAAMNPRQADACLVWQALLVWHGGAYSPAVLTAAAPPSMAAAVPVCSPEPSPCATCRAALPLQVAGARGVWWRQGHPCGRLLCIWRRAVGAADLGVPLGQAKPVDGAHSQCWDVDLLPAPAGLLAPDSGLLKAAPPFTLIRPPPCRS